MTSVLMKTTMAGPGGICHAGQIAEVPADVARTLLVGRYAVRIDPARDTAAVAPAETGTAGPPETAVTARPERRGGR